MIVSRSSPLLPRFQEPARFQAGISSRLCAARIARTRRTFHKISVPPGFRQNIRCRFLLAPPQVELVSGNALRRSEVLAVSSPRFFLPYPFLLHQCPPESPRTPAAT